MTFSQNNIWIFSYCTFCQLCFSQTFIMKHMDNITSAIQPVLRWKCYVSVDLILQVNPELFLSSNLQLTLYQLFNLCPLAPTLIKYFFKVLAKILGLIMEVLNYAMWTGCFIFWIFQKGFELIILCSMKAVIIFLSTCDL